jgi:hypothetical protein
MHLELLCHSFGVERDMIGVLSELSEVIIGDASIIGHRP